LCEGLEEPRHEVLPLGIRVEAAEVAALKDAGQILYQRALLEGVVDCTDVHAMKVAIGRCRELRREESGSRLVGRRTLVFSAGPGSVTILVEAHQSV
jgi:hypothetical protein